ncbi:NYN domain-containing protein [Longimicrobium sp.]|jgi:uncharacterized LabA/DUF88 family protein|uniref:NYN domain-containing protein n=1 Tax=Longimicrobium sp. TaxID=2029185 RepID=UPI002F92E98E
MEIFVDGTNFRLAQLDAGVRDLDIPRLARQLARGYVLVKMRYYASPLDTRSNQYRGQQRFFELLRATRAVELVLGRNEPRHQNITCELCKRTFTHKHQVEKETDVTLAVDMTVGAHMNRYDVAVLVAGDTDYVRAVEAVQQTGRKVIWCHFPGQAHTDRLRQACDDQVVLTDKFLRACR